MSIRFSLRAPTGQETVITGPFRIGRDDDCQVRLDNNLISRIHASIWIDHDHLLLRDERSRNGTRLNGQPLPPGEAHYLHHGDQVTVGDTTFVVECDPPFPNSRQHSGLPSQAEDEPPPTARLDKPGPAPAPSPALAAAAVAAAPTTVQPRRLPVLPLAIGGCLALVLLAICCALGFFAATAGGPAILTALAPPARRSATPVAAPGANRLLPPAASGTGVQLNAPTPTPPPAGRVMQRGHQWPGSLPGSIRAAAAAPGGEKPYVPKL